MTRVRADLRFAPLLGALIVAAPAGPSGSAAAQVALRSMLAPRLAPVAHAASQPTSPPALATTVIVFDRDARSAVAEHRSPLLAGALGVLPGAGHLYAGEGRRGLAVAGVWLASGLVMFSHAHGSVVGMATAVNVGTYVFSIADAALAAQRFNARHKSSASLS